MQTKESKINYVAGIERDIEFIIEQCEECKEREHVINSLRESIRLIYDPDVRRAIELSKLNPEPKISDTEYRIKHKPTGLYYQPQKQKTNISTVGKIYDSPRAWNTFKTTGCVLINNISKIYDDIVYGHKYPDLHWEPEHNSWDGDYLRVVIDLKEWEQEYIKV